MDRTDITDIVEVEETTGFEALAPETRVSRRNFMVGTGVATGFALAAQPVAAATIRTDSQGARLGTLDLRLFPNGHPLIDREAEKDIPAGRSNYRFERVSLEPHFLNDPELQKLVDAFRKGTKLSKLFFGHVF